MHSHVLLVFTAVRAVSAGGAALVVVLLAEARLQVAVVLPCTHERPLARKGRRGVFGGLSFDRSTLSCP